MEQQSPQTAPQGHEAIMDTLKQVITVTPAELARRDAKWQEQREAAKKSKTSPRPAAP